MDNELKKKLRRLIYDEGAIDDEYEFYCAADLNFKDTTFDFLNKKTKRHLMIRESELNKS